MKHLEYFLWLSISLLPGCLNHNTMTAVKEYHEINSAADSLIIAPLYPDTVYFAVQANIKKQTIVKGKLEGYHNQTVETHELYFQRFAEKQNRFRIIHCTGSALETTHEFGKECFNFNRFNDTIKFDKLGIFEGEPADPIDLIPLYPGHPVKPGEYWTPEVQVKIPMGHGIAKYSFVIDSLYKDKNNSLLGRMLIKVNADLEPTAEFTGGNVTVSGEGWIIWDCTINQRRETHLQATYCATKGSTEVKQLISINDELQTNKGQKQF